MCKAPVKLSPPTNQHPTFYRPDALQSVKALKEKWNQEILEIFLVSNKPQRTHTCVGINAVVGFNNDESVLIRFWSTMLHHAWRQIDSKSRRIKSLRFSLQPHNCISVMFWITLKKCFKTEFYHLFNFHTLQLLVMCHKGSNDGNVARDLLRVVLCRNTILLISVHCPTLMDDSL